MDALNLRMAKYVYVLLWMIFRKNAV